MLQQVTGRAFVIWSLLIYLQLHSPTAPLQTWALRPHTLPSLPTVKCLCVQPAFLVSMPCPLLLPERILFIIQDPAHPSWPSVSRSLSTFYCLLYDSVLYLTVSQGWELYLIHLGLASTGIQEILVEWTSKSIVIHVAHGT